MTDWHAAEFRDERNGNHWWLVEETNGNPIADMLEASEAHLISAAPELLEALTKLIGLMEKHPAARQPLTRGALVQARAAIAKAEGKQ